MKKKISFTSLYYLLVLGSLGVVGCRQNTPHDKRFHFPNVAQQQVAIIDDAYFFEHITKLDMCIQMHETDTSQSRDELLTQYKQLLSSSVLDTFSRDQQQRLYTVMKELCDDIERYFPNLALEQSIGLLNCNGNHYGKTAFYTRGYNIVIPPYYKEMSYDDLLKVMYHEWFHLWIRYTKQPLRDIYKLVQVETLSPIQGIDNVQLEKSAFIKQRELLNPDGLREVKYVDTLTHKYYLPVLYSKYDELKPALNDFFDYAHFQLFEMTVLKASETYKIPQLDIISENIGQDVSLFPQFFDEGYYNTDYNIHPDEILADNFAILIMIKKNKALLNQLRPEGQAFLNAFEQCLLRL